MSAAGADELAAGRVVAGRYRIEALLGRGGMGRVYRAVDDQLGRAVALKQMAAPRDGSLPPEEAVRRFLREARTAAAFSHPNVVAVYDVGEFEGSPFIAMELVRGRSLRALVGDRTIPVGERLRWLGDVARALAAAHRAGLVHRDVKPDNVIVGDDGVVKLLDFGIARRLPGPIDAVAATERDGTITVEGTLVGTPAYMAPEQLRAEKVDGRADQFAWAVTAYELLAGKKPWPSANAAELIAAVLSTPAPPLAVEGLPPSVASVIARALSKRAGDRFATMDALVATLDGTPAPRARSRVPLAWGLVAFALVAAAAVAGARFRPSRATTSAAADLAHAGAVAGGRPHAYPCPPARRAADQPQCGYGLQAWCDPAGVQVGCCRAGLVPVDSDGICGCPPGGTREGTECPKATSDERILIDLDEAIGKRLANCPRDEHAVLDFVLRFDADGRLFDERIAESRVADATLQRCILDQLRGLTIEPPPDGFLESRLPLTVFPPPRGSSL